MFLTVVDLDKYFHIIDYSGKITLTTACGINFKRNVYNLLSIDGFPNNLCPHCAMANHERFAIPDFRYDRSVNEQNITMKSDRLNNVFRSEHSNQLILDRRWKMLSKLKSHINKVPTRITPKKRKIHD